MMPIVSSPRWRSAASGASRVTFFSGLGVGGRKTSVATSAIAISAETPKNGPRQEMPPRTPPRSGPTAMPRPSAVS